VVVFEETLPETVAPAGRPFCPVTWATPRTKPPGSMVIESWFTTTPRKLRNLEMSV
jgi:hypothetical protein